MTDYPRIPVGSIVKITVPGSRSSGGLPVAVPAVVLDQFEADGALKLFTFHFEGQFMAIWPVQTAVPERYQDEQGEWRSRMVVTANVEVLFHADTQTRGAAPSNSAIDIEWIRRRHAEQDARIAEVHRNLDTFQKFVMKRLSEIPAGEPSLAQVVKGK